MSHTHRPAGWPMTGQLQFRFCSAQDINRIDVLFYGLDFGESGRSARRADIGVVLAR
jgi:hypothetical protein